MWNAIAYVSSGVTLTAFVIATVAWFLKHRAQQQERLIKAANTKDRAALIRNALEFFHVDATELSPSQQYKLAVEQVHARAARFKTTAIVICVLAVLAAAVSIYALARSTRGSTPQDFPAMRSSFGITMPQLQQIDVGLTRPFFFQVLGAPRVAHELSALCGARRLPFQYARWSDNDHEVQALFDRSDNAAFLVVRALRGGASAQYSYGGMPWRLTHSTFADITDHPAEARDSGTARHMSYTERVYFGRPGRYHHFYFTMQISSYLANEVGPAELAPFLETRDVNRDDPQFYALRRRAYPNAVGISGFEPECDDVARDDPDDRRWEDLMLAIVGTFAEDFEPAG